MCIRDSYTTLIEVIASMDEPLGDPSAVPTWLVSQAIASEHTVVLGGDGADELLGGYLCWGRDLVNLALNPPTVALSDRIRRTRFGRGRRSDDRQSDARGKQYLDVWRNFRNYLTHADANLLGLGDCLEPLPRTDQGFDATLDDIGRWDLATYLPGDILVKTDRMSMAHGLEMRSPFLDPDVSDLLLRMPWVNKVSSQTEKVVLRDAFAHRWPSEVSSQPKHGFGAPRDDWMGDGPIGLIAKDLLASPGVAIHDHLPAEHTQRLVAEGGQLGWSIAVLALWLERER